MVSMSKWVVLPVTMSVHQRPLFPLHQLHQLQTPLRSLQLLLNQLSLAAHFFSKRCMKTYFQTVTFVFNFVRHSLRDGHRDHWLGFKRLDLLLGLAYLFGGLFLAQKNLRGVELQTLQHWERD
jgi:hypothetical protein